MEIYLPGRLFVGQPESIGAVYTRVILENPLDAMPAKWFLLSLEGRKGHLCGMAEKKIVAPANAAPAVGPYNPAVRVDELIFCSGQIPVNPADPQAPLPEDVPAQTERVLENVKLLLESEGLTLANVVKTTVFLTDLANFKAMNEVYAQYFTENQPARSTFQVAGLPLGAQVEIEVVAHA